MNIQIHNLSALPTIDYRTVSPLQGDLKDLSEKNADKLKRVLQKRGFTTPLFLWQDEKAGLHYLVDGHQRHRIMMQHDMNDHGNYKVPYVLIPAKDIKEAKEQLLEITSQYGHMTVDGLDEYAADLDLSELDVSFEGIDLDKLTALDNLEDEEPEEAEKPKVKRYTTNELRTLAKGIYPAEAPAILDFLDVVDRNG